MLKYFDLKRLDSYICITSLAFVFLRAYIVFSQFPAFVGGDTISYRPVEDMPDYLSFLRYWPDTLTGNSVRSILPISIYYFLPSDNLRMLVQSLISIFAWLFMAISIFFYLQGISKNLFAKTTPKIVFSILLLFGLSPQINEWNKLLYSESIILSTFCVFVGVIFTRTRSNLEFAFRIVILSLLSFLLITARVNLTPWLFFFLGFFIARNLTFFTATRILRSFVFVVFLLGTLFISFSYLNAQNENWKNFVGREVTSISYYLSEDNPAASSFINSLELLDYPDCIDFPNTPIQSGQQMFWGAQFYEKNASCSEGAIWMENNLSKIIKNWIFEFPFQSAQTYRRAFLASSRHIDLFAYSSPIPASINSLLFPQVSTSVSLPDVYNSLPGREALSGFDPIMLWSALLVIYFIYFRKSLGRFEMKLLFFYLISILTFLLSLTLGILAIPGPQAEVYRIALVAWIPFRMNVLILLILLFSYRFRVSKETISKS